ncbi:ribosomal protein L19 protein [Toxoplasma gondii p89]|uniref:50S ribosomal protein L19, chloroplastic n=1 Tax=Toxoplasma gondii p89 TaxID=943119 RepID=A0A086KZV0_TOXGO|nr:ribosomal protein L19 protein [Toxoplasma gondii p89]
MGSPFAYTTESVSLLASVDLSCCRFWKTTERFRRRRSLPTRCLSSFAFATSRRSLPSPSCFVRPTIPCRRHFSSLSSSPASSRRLPSFRCRSSLLSAASPCLPFSPSSHSTISPPSQGLLSASSHRSPPPSSHRFLSSSSHRSLSPSPVVRGPHCFKWRRALPSSSESSVSSSPHQRTDKPPERQLSLNPLSPGVVLWPVLRAVTTASASHRVSPWRLPRWTSPSPRVSSFSLNPTRFSVCKGGVHVFSRRFHSPHTSRKPTTASFSSSSSSRLSFVSPSGCASPRRASVLRRDVAGASVSLGCAQAARVTFPLTNSSSSPSSSPLPRRDSLARSPLSVSSLSPSFSCWSASLGSAASSASAAHPPVSALSRVFSRALRHRVLPSSLPNRLFSVDNRETTRFWPPPLQKEEDERRGAFVESCLQPSGKASLLQPPQCLPRAPSHLAKLMEEEERLRLYRHLKKEERDAATLNKFGIWAGEPIADTPAAKMQPLVARTCRQTMRHLQQIEIERLDKQRNFQVPLFGPGDLMEVKYELSRSQQTFATFQGYCVEVRKKRLNSSFVLRNSYEGIGVEQRIPLYSPRIISLKVVSSCASPTQDFLLERHKPLTRDYRYKWKYNFRGRWSRRIGKHKPGIRSVEKKIRQRIVRIRKRYMGQRIEAGLPPYVWGGPYPQYGRKRSLFIRGEMYRRMLIYSFDERRRRAEKLRKRRQAVKWGVFKLRQPSVPPALTALPTYHPLYPGNLPK